MCARLGSRLVSRRILRFLGTLLRSRYVALMAEGGPDGAGEARAMDESIVDWSPNETVELAWSESDKYRMRISRLTIDQLGIRMYDRVAAVLAELVANAY